MLDMTIGRKTLFVRLFSWITLVVATMPVGNAQLADGGSDGVVHLKKIGEVIERWAPENRVFVRGDVSVGNKQLKELADWLKQHAPHWTVVLVDSAQGEEFTSSVGVHHRNLDALEESLAELSNKTDFGHLIHPLTGEQDGTIFYMSLKDRAFGYRSSDAQDRRNLGGSHWANELDREAIRAMRNGGRILDAVKNTITDIDSRLARMIQSEVDAAAQREAERKRVVAEVVADVAAAQQHIQALTTERDHFLNTFAEAKGPLAQPPVEAWTSRLVKVAGDLNSDNAREHEGTVRAIETEIAKYRDGYAFAAHLIESVQEFHTKIDALKSTPYASVNQLIGDAESSFLKSQAAASAGEWTAANLFEEAEGRLAAAESRLSQELQNTSATEARRATVRNSVAGTSSVVIILIGGVLFILNRRRRSSMTRAEKTLEERRAAAETAIGQVDELFKRNEEVLGSRERIESRGYTGRTRSLSLQALDYVDDLFIMAREIKRVLSEGESLIRPRKLNDRLVNLFSSSRFEQGINHISGTPLQFERSTGIPLIFKNIHREGGNSNALSSADERSDLSTSEMPDRVQLTFEEVFAAFRARSDAAESALNTIVQSLSTVQDRLQELQTRLSGVQELDKQLDQANAKDGLFDVPSLLRVTLPAIQSDLDRGDEAAAFDAVSAMEGPLSHAEHRIEESTAFATMLLQARDSYLKELAEKATALRSLGYPTSWIDRAVDQLQAEADQVFARIADQFGTNNDALPSTAQTEGRAAIDQWQSSVITLVARAGRSAESAETLEKKLVFQRQKSLEDITRVRKSLAEKLGASEQIVLREPEFNPDAVAEQCRKSIDGARAVLQQGDADSASTILISIAEQLSHIERILTDSMEAADTFDAKLRTLRERAEQLAGRTAASARSVENAREQYSSAALQLHYSEIVTAQLAQAIGRSGEHEHVVAATGASSGTADQLIADCLQALQKVRSEFETLEAAHRSAALLSGSVQMVQANDALDTCSRRLDRVDAHIQSLDARSRENEAAQSQCESLLMQLRALDSDPKILMSTMQAVQEAAGPVKKTREDLSRVQAGINPFDVALSITASARRLEALRVQAESDRAAHAEALRALQGAKRQMDVAQQYVRQSQTDGITDSRRTVEANQRIAGLAGQLNTLELEFNRPHCDWQSVDQRAASLQAEIAAASQMLGSELQAASEALAAFQQASQQVFQAGRWSSTRGIRIPGSPGVTDLERARSVLHSGNYSMVLEISRLAAAAAAAAIQQAEREETRRRLERERAEEQARRDRDEHNRTHSSFSSSFNSTPSSFSSSHTHSGSSSVQAPSADNQSGFGRSGW